MEHRESRLEELPVATDDPANHSNLNVAQVMGHMMNFQRITAIIWRRCQLEHRLEGKHQLDQEGLVKRFS